MAQIIQEQDLYDLITSPRERSDAEYKSDIDPNDRIAQANLARHIAALSNYGGGFIVLGFEDKTHTEIRIADDRLARFNHDFIGAVVSKYLTPQIDCQIRIVTSPNQIKHPIIWVPPHGATPTIATASGPHDAKGRPQGIEQGRVYIRTAKPETIPIQNADDWKDLIRRCVLHDRNTLLSQLMPLLQGRTLGSFDGQDRFKEWHDATIHEYKSQLKAAKAPEVINESYFCLSYQIVTDTPEKIDFSIIQNELRRAAHEISSIINYGWTAFYVFDRKEIRPYTKSSENFGEYLESSMLGDTDVDFDNTDLWRFSPIGMASIVRTFFPDRPYFNGENLPHPYIMGKWFSAYFLAREVSEIVIHAKEMAQIFKKPNAVKFRLECTGIQGRILTELNTLPFDLRPRPTGSESKDNSRTATGEWAIVDLIANWQEIVAYLISPITRAFGPAHTIDAETVRRWAMRFKEL